MKALLISILRMILFPLVWCFQTIQDAAWFCTDYNPVGFTDCVRMRTPGEPHEAACTISRADRCSHLGFVAGSRD